ncbi:hypothetical protein [Halorarum salinum]|uniref:Uncharacterized protein n=1 Tax=Halorarum salinum TaxID=2743089 RepID=A0A7D5QKA6_9EURY|nr:hypothetical protein [Halobaculum salinum]QLG64324.1 hypothetical protein HUG12_21335 [Halobaculum salinum]
MSGRTHRGVSKVGLTVGFLALLGAVLLVRRSSPVGYELSVYRGTDPIVWACLGLALATGVGAALATDRSDRVSDAGLLLTGAAVFVVATLPLLRGYYFYGAGDSLSHLGWTRELAAGSLAPVDLLYPGIHSTAVFLGELTGLPLRVALVLVVLGCYTLVFLLFVPLCVRLLDGSRLALTLGVLAALLFAPINGVSVHPNAHPASQAILFFPFVLYLVLRYSTRPWRKSAAEFAGPEDRDRVTAVGILLAIASTAVVLVHPQQALNVVLFFVAIVTVQAVYRRWRRDHPVATHRPLYAQTALVVVAFLMWAPRFERVQGAVVSTVSSVLLEGPSAGTVVASKSVSLVAIGGSLPVLFAKLFLPALVLSLFAAGLILALVTGRMRDERSEAASLMLYLAAALVPLFGVFLLLVASSAGDMYFRYHGFIMVPVTILGAVAMARAVRSLEGPRRRTGVRIALVAAFLILLPVGAAALHSSPYVYQPTQHVPESQVEGYASAFDHGEAGVEWVGIRTGPRRYVDADYGTEHARTTLEFPGYREPVGEAVFQRGNYTERFDEDRYMAVTDSAYEREVTLYDGFRYGEAGFRSLETTPGVNKVRANDGFRLYRIDGAGR